MLNEKVNFGKTAVVTLQFSEYQPKAGDALTLGNKGRYGSCVHRSYLSALVMG